MSGTEPAHSRLGFSQAERFLACPGSVAASEGIPRTTSVYAQEGTDAHSLGETCLKLKKDAADFIGSYVGSTKVSKELAEGVQLYVDTVRKLHEQMGAGAELLIESRADVTWAHKDLWGTMDAMIVAPFERAAVVDFKWGVQPVEADCDQGRGYALHPWKRYDVGEVVFLIVQPRASHPDGPVRSKTYLRPQLEHEAKRFIAGALATEQPDAPRHAGTWCKYCPAAPMCPELAKRALTTAQADFSAEKPLAPPPPHALTPAQLRAVLDNADIMEGWLKTVRGYALSQALAGRPPQGYKLIAGRRGTRKWTDEETAAKALTVAGFDPYDKSVLSPTAAEKLVGGKKAFEPFASLVTQADGKPELAPESDPRPALPAGPSADFAPIIVEEP